MVTTVHHWSVSAVRPRWLYLILDLLFQEISCGWDEKTGIQQHRSYDWLSRSHDENVR